MSYRLQPYVTQAATLCTYYAPQLLTSFHADAAVLTINVALTSDTETEGGRLGGTYSRVTGSKTHNRHRDAVWLRQVAGWDA